MTQLTPEHCLAMLERIRADEDCAYGLERGSLRIDVRKQAKAKIEEARLAAAATVPTPASAPLAPATAAPPVETPEPDPDIDGIDAMLDAIAAEKAATVLQAGADTAISNGAPPAARKPTKVKAIHLDTVGDNQIGNRSASAPADAEDVLPGATEA